MPRYNRDAADAARHAPPTERRDAPTNRSSAPPLSGSQFSASETEGDVSYTASAFISTVEDSILRTTGYRPASHPLAMVDKNSLQKALAVSFRQSPARSAVL